MTIYAPTTVRGRKRRRAIDGRQPRPLIVIPARLKSTRLTEKLLADLAGKPLLAHTIAAAKRHTDAEVWVAADDQRLLDVARAAGAQAMLTDVRHRSGTDRLAEVAQRLRLDDNQIVINLQGDEPLMPLEPLYAVHQALLADPGAALATLAQPISEAALVFDPNCVKVVCDQRQRAVYFSRAPIPYARDAFAQSRNVLPEPNVYLRHIGLYAYRAATLRRLQSLPASPLEQLESLEQLRALENGLPIRVDIWNEALPAGVDTEADLRRVAAQLALPAAAAKRATGAARKILFVCMGNICRSPLSLAYARQRAAELSMPGLQFDSAGTHASTLGRGADPRTQAIGRSLSLNLSTHRARPVEPDDFVRFDWVIAHDERNVEDLMAICPEGLSHKIKRMMDFAPAHSEREVPDPYTGDHHLFILSFQLIREAVDGLLQSLRET